MDSVLHFAEVLETLLLRIPGTFWGVLAGSFFSLGGVILSNRNSARNQRLQLAADRAAAAEHSISLNLVASRMCEKDQFR
jgi:hypothetical protein